MKAKDLKIGIVYDNDRGHERIIIAFGAQYVLYQGQQETDNLRYKVVKGDKFGRNAIGTEHNCTRKAFAKWAGWYYTI